MFLPLWRIERFKFEQAETEELESETTKLSTETTCRRFFSLKQVTTN